MRNFLCTCLKISYIGQSSALLDTKDSDNLINTLMADQFSSEKDLIKEVIENVDTNNLRSFLKELTREPEHLKYSPWKLI